MAVGWTMFVENGVPEPVFCKFAVDVIAAAAADRPPAESGTKALTPAPESTPDVVRY